MVSPPRHRSRKRKEWPRSLGLGFRDLPPKQDRGVQEVPPPTFIGGRLWGPPSRPRGGALEQTGGWLDPTGLALRRGKLPPPLQTPLGQGSACQPPPASPGRKLEMTQPKFLLLKWWGFLSAGSRPGQDHKWATLRPPPQAHGPPGEARAGRAGQPSSARADTVTPEGGREQDLGKGVQLATLPAWQRGPSSLLR